MESVTGLWRCCGVVVCGLVLTAVAAATTTAELTAARAVFIDNNSILAADMRYRVNIDQDIRTALQTRAPVFFTVTARVVQPRKWRSDRVVISQPLQFALLYQPTDGNYLLTALTPRVFMTYDSIEQAIAALTTSHIPSPLPLMYTADMATDEQYLVQARFVVSTGSTDGRTSPERRSSALLFDSDWRSVSPAAP